MRCIYVYPETIGADAHMLDSGPIGEVAVTAERAGWEGFASPNIRPPARNGWLRADTKVLIPSLPWAMSLRLPRR